MAYDWKIWTGSVKTDAWSWCTPNDKEWYSDAFVFYPGRQCTDVWMLLFFRKKGWKTVLDIYAALYDIQYLEFSVLFFTAAGGTLKWSGKEEKIAVDGRFVLEKVPFGKQKWEVLMPDGTAYQLVWKLERKKKEPVSFVFRENSPFKIRVGKQIRAIELVLTLKESTFLPDTSYRAVIDKKQKVYIPEGVIPPEEDGSNRTPAGLKVDKNGKFSIDEQRGMDK